MVEIEPGTIEPIRRDRTSKTVAAIKAGPRLINGRIDRTEANRVAIEALIGSRNEARGRTTRSFEAAVSLPSTATEAMWSTIGVHMA